jgi:hypothetical protein
MIGNSYANFARELDVINVLNANRKIAVRYKFLNKDIPIPDIRVMFPKGV